MPLITTRASASVTGYGAFLGAAAAATSFESIATVSVGSGGSSSITFSSIPATYSHLQIRLLARAGRSNAAGGYLFMQLNGSFMTAYHWLYGTGSTVISQAGSGGLGNDSAIVTVPGSTAGANIFGAGVIDILDYANTNKTKVARILSGDDLNGSGIMSFTSTLLNSTSAITSITFGSVDGVGNIPQYSHFALYGIKGAA